MGVTPWLRWVPTRCTPSQAASECWRCPWSGHMAQYRLSTDSMEDWPHNFHLLQRTEDKEWWLSHTQINIVWWYQTICQSQKPLVDTFCILATAVATGTLAKNKNKHSKKTIKNLTPCLCRPFLNPFWMECIAHRPLTPQIIFNVQEWTRNRWNNNNNSWCRSCNIPKK